MKIWRDKAEPPIEEQPNDLWEKESGRRKNKGLARQVMDLNADIPLGEIITQSLEAAPREYVLKEWGDGGDHL